MNLKTPVPSKRMQMLVELAFDGEPLWDLCCDHGYIGLFALKSERFSHVYFVDNISHIMKRLEDLIMQSPLQNESHKYSLITSRVEDLDLEVKGTCIIAGVGGRTVVSILGTLLSKKILKAKRILLSVHTDEVYLLNFLNSSEFIKFYSQKEMREIEEGRRVRKIFIFDSTCVP